MFQTLGGGSGGGGAATVSWYSGDSNSPEIYVTSNGLMKYRFSDLDEQELFCQFTLPASYTAGTRIYLKKGKVNCGLNSGNFLFKTTSYIFKLNINGISTPTGYDSTNSQQAVNGTANGITIIDDVDLTNSTGQINSVTVQPGDTILVKLIRDVSSETSGVATVVDLLAGSFELVVS